MKNCIGVRHESKDLHERRAALTPAHVRRLTRRGVKVLVEPSPTRVFRENDYVSAGARISRDLSRCNVIFGVKEVPDDELLPGKAYCFFSHTIKAQPYNMPMLRHMLEGGNTLLDYELVKNRAGRRLIAFGSFAGYAGMLDTLWAYGERLRWEGIRNPFEVLRRPLRYESLDKARGALKEVRQVIQAVGLPHPVVPMVCGVTGQGRVSRGAQEILKILPTVPLKARDLPALFESGEWSDRVIYRVEFYQGDMYVPKDGDDTFRWHRFHRYPERFDTRLTRYLPYLSILVNGIYWEPRYPRHVTRDWLRETYAVDPNPRLRVIGDITCDVEGSIEVTVKAAAVDNPVFVYEPLTGRFADGVEGTGPVIMSVDKLPTELPREASKAFGDALMPFVKKLAAANYRSSLGKLALPDEFARAIIAHRGKLAPDFAYLAEHL